MIFQHETMEMLQWLVFFKTLLSLQIMMKMKIIWIGNDRRKKRVLHQIMHLNVHNVIMPYLNFTDFLQFFQFDLA